jgi:hypothetical protein
MREPAKFLTRAFAILLMLAAAAGTEAQAASPPIALTPAVFYPVFGITPEQSCTTLPQGRSWLQEWWRHSRMTSWLHRELEEDRPAAAPFYLRSPLLSGIYGRADAACGGGSMREEPEDEDGCAKVIIRPGEPHSTRIEVPLPQLGAKNARRLGELINEKLTRGDTVMLIRRQGDRYRIEPQLTEEVATKPCRTD